MKKLLALILAAALALSLVACGGDGTGDNNTPSTPSGGNGDTTSTDTPSGGGEDNETEEPAMTKEEMLQVAEDVSWVDIQNASVENIVKAKQQYCNKVMQLKGKIWSIEQDHIVIGGDAANYLVDVYLPLDEIITLENQQVITVVGKTTDEIIDTTENVAEPGQSFSFLWNPSIYQSSFMPSSVTVIRRMVARSSSSTPPPASMRRSSPRTAASWSRRAL